MGKTSVRNVVGIGILGALALPMLPVQAQDAGSARKGVLSVTLGLDAGSNIDLKTNSNGADARASTGIRYDYTMKSATDELTFGLGINPEFVEDEDVTAQPRLTLGFSHRGSRNALMFNLSYQRAKVTDQSLAYDDAGNFFYYDGTGERSLASASAKVSGGIDMPFGYTLGLARTETDYHGNVSSSYTPSQTTTATLGLRADLSPNQQLGLSYSHRLYDVDNIANLHRRTDSLSLSLNQRLNAVTGLGFSIGRSEVETERSGVMTTTNGSTLGLSLSREDPRGSTVLSFDRSVSETGSRDQISLVRKAETRLGEFDGSIGLSRGEAGSADVVAGLGYQMNLPRDQLNLSLNRSVNTSDAGEDVLTTRFSGTLSHDLSDVNALDFGLTASLTDAPSQKTTRLDGSIAYTHQLTPEAELSAGLRLGLSERTGRDDADSQALFVTINRRFETLR